MAGGRRCGTLRRSRQPAPRSQVCRTPGTSVNSDPLRTRLDQGLTALGLALPAPERERLLAYLRLLGRWNNAYNLTAIRDPLDMVTRHLLDSLAVAPHLAGTRVLDVGTGPGLPGIPLAVACPALGFTLLDANAKKTRFVVQAVGELALKNVEVVQTRVENYRPSRTFDTVVSRAFASIAAMLAAARHLCAPGGRFLAMKGAYPEEELKALPSGYDVRVVGPEPAPDWHPVQVPYTQVQLYEPGAIPAADICIGTFWSTVGPACLSGSGRVFHLCQGFEGVHREYAPILPQIDEVYRLPVPKLIISKHLEPVLRERYGCRCHFIGQVLDSELFSPGPARSPEPTLRIGVPLGAPKSMPLCFLV